MNQKYELHNLCQFPQHGTIRQIQRCLEQGADINSLNDKGAPALVYAIKAKAVDVVRYLLDNKANPNFSSLNLYLPLVGAVVMDSTESIELTSTLLAYPETDVNQYGAKRVTALYVAAQIGNAALVALLIEKGARPINVFVNSNYQSPLYIALHNKYCLIAEKLIHHFPDLVNHPDALGFYPLHQAAQHGLTHLVDVLIEKEANIHVCVEDKITPLYFAAQNGHAGIVFTLIEKGAKYRQIGNKFENGDLIIPLQIAGMYGHIEVVKLLLNYPHNSNELVRSLDYTFGTMMRCRDFKQRQKIHECSELIKKEINKLPATEVLTLDDYDAIDWEESFTILFSKIASNEDKFPNDKDSAIRYALASMHRLLRNPRSCAPYLKHLSSDLEHYWQTDHAGQSFPKFDSTRFELWAHQGLLWPIPTDENHQYIKKFSLLDNMLLDKFQQYGMGAEQSKWTGFIPEDKSNPLLLSNVFFTENRRTINGLFHGNVHNIQRVILLLAIEAGDIPLTYTKTGGQMGRLEPKEVFSAFVRTDIFFSEEQEVLWGEIMDSANEYNVSFTYPYCLHSLLLTNNAFSGTLQDYMLFSFCNNFIKMRQLFNHVYGTTYTNKTLCDELSKLQLHLFSGLPEFAIQMDKKKVLSEVKKIDEMPEEVKSWSILAKYYGTLKGPAARYGSYLNKQSCFFKNKEAREQEQAQGMQTNCTFLNM
jgi:ankyrin repeat protein